MKQRDILFLLTSIFLLVCAWISFTIYHSAISSKINQEVIEQTLPIVPAFNTNALEALKGRELVNPLDSFPQTQQPVISLPVPSQSLLQSQIVPSTTPANSLQPNPAQQIVTPSPSQLPTGSINTSL